MGVAQDGDNILRQILLAENACPDGIINVVIDIGNLVRTPHHLPLQRLRDVIAGVPQDAQPHFVGQVQTHAVLFQIVHHPQALLVMTEGLAQAIGEGCLTGMTKGGVPQVMPHGNGLCQILVQSQRPGHGAGNAGHFQRVGHAGAVVVSLRAEEHLGFVHQAAECLAVDNAVVIPLEAGAHIVLHRLLLTGATGGLVGKGSKGV